MISDPVKASLMSAHARALGRCRLVDHFGAPVRLFAGADAFQARDGELAEIYLSPDDVPGEVGPIVPVYLASQNPRVVQLGIDEHVDFEEEVAAAIADGADALLLIQPSRQARVMTWAPGKLISSIEADAGLYLPTDADRVNEGVSQVQMEGADGVSLQLGSTHFVVADQTELPSGSEAQARRAGAAEVVVVVQAAQARPWLIAGYRPVPCLAAPQGSCAMVKRLMPMPAHRWGRAAPELPDVLYHGTRRDFDRPMVAGELGVHLGTHDQAQAFTGGDGGNLRPLTHTLQNPLRLEDNGWFTPDTVGPQLEALGLLSFDENETTDLDLRMAIALAGYDSVVYVNRREGSHDPFGPDGLDGDYIDSLSDEEFLDYFPEAEDSFIALFPEQVRSALLRGIDYRRLLDTSLVSRPAFAQWFGDSVLTDGNGAPRVMFHVTAADVAEPTPVPIPFQRGSSFSGYLLTTDRGLAEDAVERVAAAGGPDCKINEVYARIERPLTQRSEGLRPDELEASRCDGVVNFEHSRQRGFEAYAFSADQILPISGVPRMLQRAAKDAHDAWIAESVIKDQAGDPLIVWHGTPAAGIDAFDLRRAGQRTDYGNVGIGIYTSPKRFLAEAYAGRGGAVIPLQAAISRPLRLLYDDRYQERIEALAQSWGIDEPPEWKGAGIGNKAFAEAFTAAARARGHDGAMTVGHDGLPIEVVAFDSRQLKHAFHNAGTYDPENPSINLRLGEPSPRGPARSQAFERWFEGSVARTISGDPVVFYHGSNAAFGEFEPRREGDGIYFSTDAAYAAGYAEAKTLAFGGAQTVYPVHLALKNPLHVNGEDKAAWERYVSRGYDTRALAAAGHDGILVTYADGETEAMVFDPSQVRSALAGEEAIARMMEAAEKPAPQSERLDPPPPRPRLSGFSPGELRKLLIDRIGPGVETLERHGLLRFASAIYDLPPDLGELALRQSSGKCLKGLLDNRDHRAYLIAGNITDPEEAVRMLMHELGGHFYLRDVLGRRSFRQLVRRVQRLAETDARVQATVERVKNNYKRLDPSGDTFWGEVIAHLAERPEMFSQPWHRRLVTDVKRFLLKIGLSTRWITAADIGAFAAAGLRAMSEPTFRSISKGLSPVQQFLRAVRQGHRAAMRLGNQVESPAFRRWFGLSKVRDPNTGAPRVMYHGTRADIDAFSPERIGARFKADAEGFFFIANPLVACHYADAESPFAAVGMQTLRDPDPGANVVPAFLALQKPLTLERYLWRFDSNPQYSLDDRGLSLIGFYDKEKRYILEVAREEGCDGIYFEHDGDALAVALSPHQIKSAIGNAGTFSLEDPRLDRRIGPGGIYYSSLSRAVSLIRHVSAPASQWIGWVRNLRGVKKEEITWTGIIPWLEERGAEVISRDALLNQLREQEVRLEEVLLGTEARPDAGGFYAEEMGDDRWGAFDKDHRLLEIFDDEVLARQYAARRNDRATSDARYTEYRAAGGRDYRELLVLLPHRDDDEPTFRSEHYPYPNLLAHARFSTFVDGAGRKTLFIEELQSDWHQRGRREGYGGAAVLTVAPPAEAGDNWQVLSDGRVVGYVDAEDEAGAHQAAARSFSESRLLDRVPEAPFKTEWPTLLLKRLIRWAAENGHEQIAWTTGRQQADRYNLTRLVDTISYLPSTVGTYTVEGYKGDTATLRLVNVPIERVREVIGVGLADAIQRGAGVVNTYTGYYDLRGQDLQVGGEGLIKFYDDVLPRMVKRYVQQWGAEISPVNLPIGGAPTRVMAIPVTPAMREDALAGQPMFALAPVTESPAFQQWFEGSSVVDEAGAPQVVWHGTSETEYLPAVQRAGMAQARDALIEMALRHGIREWLDVPSVLERWVAMGQGDVFGATAADASRARDLLRQARSVTEQEARRLLGFESFTMPSGRTELGSHFGTLTQASARGTAFPFYLSMRTVVRLPDLGDWAVGRVMDALEAAGHPFDWEERDQVLGAADPNAALRSILLGRGIQGIVYRNETEGQGDSFIALDPRQIKSADANIGLFDPADARVNYRLAESAPVDPTSTEAFRRWFGSSQVTDRTGRPLVAYHGTYAAGQIDEFIPPGEFGHGRHPSSELGIYFSESAATAEVFAGKHAGAIMPVYLRIENPYVMTWGEFRRQFAPENVRYAQAGDVEWEAVVERVYDLRDQVQAAGHDGILVKRSRSSSDPEGEANTWVAFDPRQIKSALGNRGTFDPEDARINYRLDDPTETPAFKAWFGDWQAALAERQLDEMDPISIAVPEEWVHLDKAALRREVARRLDEAVKRRVAIPHPVLGEIRIGAKGARKTISQSPDEAKLLIAADLAEALPKSIVLAREPGNRLGVIQRDTLAARVTVGDTSLVGLFAVNLQPDGHWYYNTVVVTAAYQEKDPGAYASPSADGGAGETLLTRVSSFVRRPLRRVNPLTISKVVDADGRPLVAYHGTRSSRPISKFRMPSYFTNTPTFADAFGTAATYPVYIAIKNPYVIDGLAEGRHYEWDREDISGFKAQGYDGVIVRHPDGDVYTPFDQAQIKSALGNRGAFDPEDARINYRLDEQAQAGAIDDFQARVIAAQEIQDDVRAIGRRLRIGGDGSITLVHATSPSNAEIIARKGLQPGSFLALSERDARPHAAQHPELQVLRIKVDARDVSFSTGTGEFYAEEGLEMGPGGVWARPARVALTMDRAARFSGWFRESKVVDDAGRPKVVYHGTNQDIARFDPTHLGTNTTGVSSIAFFFTEEPQEADEYARMASRHLFSRRDDHARAVKRYQRQIAAAERQGDWDTAERLMEEWDALEADGLYEGVRGQNIVPVHLRIEKPLVLDLEGSMDGYRVAEAIQQARREGYDGLKLVNVFDPIEARDGKPFSTTVQWVALDPKQIKSAVGNSGAYGLQTDRIDLRLESAPASRARITGSQAFKAWFGNSQVVDEDGRPMVAFHGANRDFDQFRRSFDGTLGQGIYFTTDARTASRYAEMQEGGEVVYPVYLSAQKLFDVDANGGQPPKFTYGVPNDDLVKLLKEQGYDGIRWGHEILVFDPEQVKSATGNRGGFDRANPRIDMRLDDEPKDVTSSQAFEQWFKGSQVVDDHGKPLVVYHGGADAKQFNAPTFFTDSKSAAESYRFERYGIEGGAVTDAYLSITKPATEDDVRAAAERAGVEADDAELDAWRLISPIYKDDRHLLVIDELRREGFDGAFFDSDYSFEGRGDRIINSWVVFRPEQIKSATGNRGSFDPADPRIDMRLDEESHPAYGTAAFRKWFGDSQVVDADGKPLVVYHGTAEDFASFNMARGGEVWGASDSRDVMWFTSAAKRANAAAADAAAVKNDYPGDYRGAAVMPAFIRIEKPFWPTARQIGDPELLGRAIAKAKKDGHDGVVMPGEMGGHDYAVFRPEQIKSATGNRGTFDPEDPRIDMRLDDEPKDVTTSQAFQRWFKDSKVVDAGGKPLVVYHGTDATFEDFRYGEFGFHFGNEKQAQRLGSKIMPVYLSINNPIRFDTDFSNWGDEEALGDYLVKKRIITRAEAGRGNLQGLLMEKGFDGYTYPNGFEGGGTSYAVFSPEQIKSASGNRGAFDPEDPRIDMRVDETPAPATLSPAFKRWFGQSKGINADGTPKIFYHGTPNAHFTSFRPASYFTESPHYASRYTTGSASSMSKPYQEPDSPAVLPVYLSIQRPFDTRLRECRDLFMRDFFRKRGNGSDLSERGLPDWTDGYDLIEWIEEEGLPYDCLVLDEAGDALGWRGASYVPLSPSQIKSAWGNSGDFDPNDPRFDRRLEGDSPQAAHTLIGFHGSDRRYRDLVPSARGTFGSGIYFAGEADQAREIGPVVHRAAVALLNPWVVRVPHDDGPRQAEDIDHPALGSILTLPGGRALVDQMKEAGEFGFGPELTQVLRSLGHDGVIAVYPDGSKEIVAFDSGQVELTTIWEEPAQEGEGPGPMDAPVASEAPRSWYRLDDSVTFESWNAGNQLVDASGSPRVFYWRDGGPGLVLTSEPVPGAGVTTAHHIACRRLLDLIDSAEHRAFARAISPSAGVSTAGLVDRARALGFDGIRYHQEGHECVAPCDIEQVRPAQAVHPVTTTAAFKAWFGESKVVTPAGTPQPCFHGTVFDFEAFDPAKASMGDGIYLATDPDDVAPYCRQDDGRILPLYVRICNPYVVTHAEWDQGIGCCQSPEEVRRGGVHDGYLIKGWGARGDAWIAFSPDQIKSAIGNTGYFDPEDPRISLRVDQGRQLDMVGGYADHDTVLKDTIITSSRGGQVEVTLPNVNSGGSMISRTVEGARRFWSWFQGSATVDDGGRPIRFFHGTGGDVSRFEVMRDTVNTGLMGFEYPARRAGIFFTKDPGEAGHYAGDAGAVMPVYLRMERPADFRSGISEQLERDLEEAGYNVRLLYSPSVQHTWELFDEEFGGVGLVAALKKAGYDGAIINDLCFTEDGGSSTSYIAFDPGQIKSAIGNRGSFSRSSEDISLRLS